MAFFKLDFSQCFCGWPTALSNSVVTIAEISQCPMHLCTLSFKELILKFCASAVIFMRLCVLGYEDPLKGNL